MSTKEYLKQLQKMDVMIKQRQQEKDEIRAMLGSIGSFDYSKDRVQTSPSGDAQYVKMIERITDIDKEIARLIEKYADKKHEIISQIQSLENNKHIEILYKRYVEFKQPKIIADETSYTYQYVILLHGNALKEFSEKYST